MFRVGDLVRIRQPNEESCIAMTPEMKRYVGENAYITKEGMNKGFFTYRLDIDDGKGEWFSFMLEPADAAEGKPKRFAKVAKEMTALYVKKNHDYGDTFSKMHQEFGLAHAAIRLTDKVNRFKQLIRGNTRVKDESMRDTLMDLACYAVMTILELDGETDECKD